jgi:hypothetical protein
VSAPTPAQLTALRLAARDPDGVRYFRGGWYTTQAAAGSLCLPKAEHRTFTAEHVTPNTLTACEARGWLVENGAVGIYNKRWTFTDAARAALARTDGKE